MVISKTYPPILDDIVSRLAKGLMAERIYLFGSQASDQARQDSDYDLLVVVPRSELPRHRREAIFYDLLWGLTIPVDVIVLTRAEFIRSVKVKTSLAATAQASGILLYDRPQVG
jgi:predicted nucleotidyltransferase